MRFRDLFIGVFFLIAFTWAQAPQLMLRVEGESFSGRKVVLPEATKGHVAVLIFGFSKKSKEPTSAWGDKLTSDFGTRAGVEVYQLPVLEDVPRLIRGMVISGIKKGIKEDSRDHFVPILQGEAQLKKLVGYKEPDDAYLIVLNRDGQIVQQAHGAFSGAAYGHMRSEIQSLLAQR